MVPTASQVVERGLPAIRVLSQAAVLYAADVRTGAVHAPREAVHYGGSSFSPRTSLLYVAGKNLPIFLTAIPTGTTLKNGQFSTAGRRDSARAARRATSRPTIRRRASSRGARHRRRAVGRRLLHGGQPRLRRRPPGHLLRVRCEDGEAPVAVRYRRAHSRRADHVPGERRAVHLGSVGRGRDPDVGAASTADRSKRLQVSGSCSTELLRNRTMRVAANGAAPPGRRRR